MNEITTETRVKALLEVATRLQKCADNQGKHIELCGIFLFGKCSFLFFLCFSSHNEPN